MDADKVLNSIQKTLRFLVGATVVLYLAVGFTVYTTRQDSQDTKTALCTFRADLQQRLDGTRAYLEQNPEGFPGVPAAALTQSIRNQQATLDSLKTLDCN